MSNNYEFVVVILSEHWIKKHLGKETLFDLSNVQDLEKKIYQLIEQLLHNFSGTVLFGNFLDSAFPSICNNLENEQKIGFGRAVERLNLLIEKFKSERFLIIDLKTAVHISGGAESLGRRSYFLAKLGFEIDGFVAVAREMASAIADCFGQAHRLLALDWDNTIWGGEIAELGPHHIDYGLNSSRGHGYHNFQEYCSGLSNTGVLLAAVSRNSPLMAEKLIDNREILLQKSQYASLHVNFAPKSELISAVADDVNFGEEYFLFIDDSVELCEVLIKHEYIDLLRAEKAPEKTLEQICKSRYFNRLKVQQEDIQKASQFKSLNAAKTERQLWNTNEDFLESICIELEFSEMSKNNSEDLSIDK